MDDAALYTCPMHPEVQQNKPGNCPKCGMTLERKSGKAAEGQDENAELSDMTRRMWIGGALATPVFVMAMAHVVPALSQTWVAGNASRWDWLRPCPSWWVWGVVRKKVCW